MASSGAETRRRGPIGWHVSARMDGAEVETRLSRCRVWCPTFVRGSDARLGSLRPYLQMLRCSWTYMASVSALAADVAAQGGR